MALVLVFMVSYPLSAFAEIKTLITEATYTMGDGESPSFAEAMALQRAKQTALEEAGTYVQSYTKSLNQDLTADEVETIAGGLLQVEVLEKTRTLIGEGLRFYTKIKATVTTDKMEELARRIKGKDVVAEYKKLQADYTQLSQELETWKQTAGKSPARAERETAYEQILAHQKALTSIWTSQDGLVRSLVSGQNMVVAADHEKETLDELVRTMVTQGHTIELGKGKVVRTDSAYRLIVPVTMKLKEEVFRAVTDAAQRLHGTVWPKLDVETSNSVRVGNRAETSSPISIMAARLSEDLLAATSFQESIDRLTLLLELRDGMGRATYCLPRSGNRGLDDDRSLEMWHGIRRVQPVRFLLRAKGDSKESIRAINVLSPGTVWDSDELSATIYTMRMYQYRARGPDGKVLPGYVLPHVTTEKGYVALIRHEAKFRVAISLSADSARSLKQITAAIIAGDPLSLPPEADMVACTILPEE